MPRVRLPSASSSTSSSTETSLRAANAALVAPTERVSSGTFSPADAHHLFDELLRQATPVLVRPLDGFLAALARAPPSHACSDGPALAIDLFGRMSRGAGPRVLPPTKYTYNILMDCCRRVRRLDLTLAIFGRLFRTGIGANVVTFSSVLRSLCDAKRTEEAMDVLLHRMRKLGCIPNAISYNILLKGFCDDRRSQIALEILRMMAKGDACLPNVVTYNTVIYARRIEEAKDFFATMSTYELVPSVVTYNVMLTNLIKEGLLTEADDVFTSMEKTGCAPDSRLLNNVARLFLEKGEIIRAGYYLSKIDEKNFSLEASTVELLISLFSRGIYQKHINLLPE
ncbi:hypothetical protein PR202_ga05677 [Eleusine coracana subsp. coracana]|uniref:Pentatricopeptide repeat-containing protein n=1 Tax=Eleusine coracana subsp. coracana TaxID=191504 RepID=A0AAV5BUY4_ELECO|nr:hypothetical protein PR202_ga05223 [Eleusine coracana subsp. coracana]GJM89480.1 hypothetical protein PR202_ga05677 [Eleusine coracana subsp. coracana]